MVADKLVQAIGRAVRQKVHKQLERRDMQSSGTTPAKWEPAGSGFACSYVVQFWSPHALSSFPQTVHERLERKLRHAIKWYHTCQMGTCRKRIHMQLRGSILVPTCSVLLPTDSTQTARKEIKTCNQVVSHLPNGNLPKEDSHAATWFNPGPHMLCPLSHLDGIYTTTQCTY